MTPMESALWGTTLALHATDTDGGLGAADDALIRLSGLYNVRSRRPTPDEEVAELNAQLTYDEFVPWYTVAHRIYHRRDPAYKAPTSKQIDEIYKRYSLNQGCFY